MTLKSREQVEVVFLRFLGLSCDFVNFLFVFFDFLAVGGAEGFAASAEAPRALRQGRGRRLRRKC